MADNITAIIDDIKRQGYKAFEDIIARKESEKFFIDFKRTEKDDYSGQRTLYTNDKKNFAKAISGFGNSEGGIIIWGIDAAGSVDDYAKSIKPIDGVDNFKSLLESFVSLLTLPVHKTVESFAVKKNDNDKEGLAVTVIPKGNDRPYQNINNSDCKYYMRAGDSFVPVTHGILQGMFGQSPQSDVYWMFIMGNESKLKIADNGAIKFDVGLMGANGGLGIAEDIYGYARVWAPSDNCEIGVKLTDAKNYDFQQSFGLEFSFMSQKDFRLGHYQRTQMMTMCFELLPPFTRNLTIQLLIGARNQQVYEMEIEKTPEELNKIYNQCVVEKKELGIDEIWGQKPNI